MSSETKKNKIIICVCAALFGIIGIYLTFIRGNISGYDSQVKAYRIEANAREDSDSTVYYPTFYYVVNGDEYTCKTNSGTSAAPNEKKNMVYYDSKNPQRCRTEYETSTSTFAGIICLSVAALILFFVFRNPNTLIDSPNPRQIHNEENSYDEEKAQKVVAVVGKVQLIVKRLILGTIILILLVFVLIDTALFSQTMKAKDYIETTAEYVRDEEPDDDIFDNYVYTFKDKNDVDQEIIISTSKELDHKDQIKIKYNENNPQDFYEETALLDNSGIRWYIGKVVVLILLIVLFFNKKLLNKINISARS